MYDEKQCSETNLKTNSVASSVTNSLTNLEINLETNAKINSEINTEINTEISSEMVLVKLARKGDANAFAKLYETVYKDLYYFALYVMKNQQDAEDAVSETIIAAYENIKKLRIEEAFRSWIFKILSNICKKKLKIRSKKEETETVQQKQEEMAVEGKQNFEEKQDIRDAWKLLTEEERYILSLSVFAGYNSKEIGEILGENGKSMNTNTVRSKRSRALKKLGKILI